MSSGDVPSGTFLLSSRHTHTDEHVQGFGRDGQARQLRDGAAVRDP